MHDLTEIHIVYNDDKIRYNINDKRVGSVASRRVDLNATIRPKPPPPLPPVWPKGYVGSVASRRTRPFVQSPPPPPPGLAERVR